MSSLIKQAQGKLNKAGDAGRDPADLSDDEPDSGPASASGSATESNSVIISASGNDDFSADPHAVGVADSSADTDASSTASRKAGTRESGNADTDASSTKQAKRRVGRPTGPARTALTVRVLTQIDQALTDAVEDTGLSPQYIADEALHTWLAERGYLSHT